MEQFSGAGFGCETVDQFHFFIERMQVFIITMGVGFSLGDCRLGLTQFTVAIDYEVHCGAARIRAFLGDVSENIIWMYAELPFVGLQFAQEHHEQRRLATAVRTDQTHALTGMRLECDVLDEQISPAANADLLEV